MTSQTSKMTRRGFMKSSAGAMIGASLLSAKSVRAVPGANEKIRLGLIGSGGMGRGDLKTFLAHKDTYCPVICDVDDGQINSLKDMLAKAGYDEPDSVKDFRQVIERDDVDAVIVATPDHWHALPTLHACQAGKDVYCEKPLATSIGEGRKMVDAARKYDRVVQMGTQWRSCPHFAEPVEYVQSGKLGKIRQVRCWAYLDWVHPVGKPEDRHAPDGVDYNMWLGPAPERPFNPARFHFTFRWFWDYAGGLMTDWGVHLINIAMWAMGASWPKNVSSAGGKYVWDDISETPDTQHTLFRFDDFTMIWEHQMGGSHGCEGREHGVAFHGTEAVLILGNPGWEVVPLARQGEKAAPIEKHGPSGTDGRPEHVRNFLDCMRSRTRPVEDVEIGHYVSTVAHLGNLACRGERSILWDHERERVVGRNDLGRLVTYPYRQPWTLDI